MTKKETLFVTLRYNTSVQKFLHPLIDEINVDNVDDYSFGRGNDHEPSKRRRLRTANNDREETNDMNSSELDHKFKREVLVSKHSMPKNKVQKLNFTLRNTDLSFFEFLDSNRIKHTTDTKTQNKLYVSGTEYENLGMSGFVCGFCFRCFLDEFQYTYHVQNPESCEYRVNTSDDVIYDDTDIVVKQLDGLTNSITLQRLSSLSKLFIPHKLNNASDIIKFDFFLLYVNNNFIGYFSKEKNTKLWNLSCILVIKKSALSFRDIKKFEFGQFLIHFSYQLSILDEYRGSPEKPFSDFGLLAYRKYFKFRLVKYFLEDAHCMHECSMEDISRSTGMVKNDIVFGLESIGVFQYSKKGRKIKVDEEMLRAIQHTDEYHHWWTSITHFDKQHFKDFVKKIVVDDNIKSSNDTISLNSNNDWIDVDQRTKISLFKALSDTDHTKYTETFK